MWQNKELSAGAEEDAEDSVEEAADEVEAVVSDPWTMKLDKERLRLAFR